MPAHGIPYFVIRLFEGRRARAIIRQKRNFAELRGALAREASIFSYRGIAFGGAIAEKIRNNISHHIIGLMIWAKRLERFIDSIGPRALVSNGTRDDDAVLAELCKNKGIPSILVSHGSHVPPKNDCERIEWGEHGRMLLRAPFSGLALQSPLAEGYLGAFPTESVVFRTGPLIWGKPIERRKDRELFNVLFKGKFDRTKSRIIVHAGTPKPNKFLRPHVYETPDEYIQGIRDLVGRVEDLSNTLLIVKFRPSADIDVDDMKRLVDFSERAVLSVNEPFNKVLGMTDLLVSFSSTTIEEALQNRVPVLLYGGGGRYQHIEAFEIAQDREVPPKAVYHVSSVRDLGYAIKKILDLNMPESRHGGEFDPYRYAVNRRVSLIELLKKQGVA